MRKNISAADQQDQARPGIRVTELLTSWYNTYVMRVMLMGECFISRRGSALHTTLTSPSRFVLT